METEVLIEHKVKQKTESTKSIVVYNDNNTFNWVIECFIKYCGHTPEQSEQCAYIVHYKGKCIVKHASYDKLKPICEALLESGLTAKIE